MNQLRILIVRPDRIGDVVLSTPIPREIKRVFPQSYIAVLLKPYTKDIYENNPYIDKIILYNEKELSFNHFFKIRKYNFTHAFMLLPTEKINWILFYCGIKKRIGVGQKFYQFVTNTKSVYRRHYNPPRHEADYCLDMVRKIEINPLSNEPEIHLSEPEIERVYKLKSEYCPNNEMIIGINSTSGESAPNWKINEYKKLIEKLLLVKNAIVAVTDNNPPEEIKNIKHVIYPNIGNTLRESILNFAALDLLVSNSTGPMHIASALKIKTISLFSREPACSPQLWGPLGNDSTILLPEKNADIQNAFPDPKNYHFEGEGGINAETVFNKIISILI